MHTMRVENQTMNDRRGIVIARCGGFTLMEVLVTVVILSIGLLGVAGLQFGSLRGNQSAFNRSIAVALAADGADRLRANTPGVKDPVTGALRDSYKLTTSAGSDVTCMSSGCSYDDVAKHDAYEWISSVVAQLPGGEGTICRDSTPYDGTGSAKPECEDSADANGLNIYAVKVWWDDDRDPSTPKVAYITSIVP
jgi:type IV pilus assembly protein PilV